MVIIKDLLILIFPNLMENILQEMDVSRDKDGYYWITGRVDDVIIVSGHNLGTAEIESAFVAHPKVAEAAVVGYPHDIKGNGLYCYVTLNAKEKADGELRKRIKTMGKKTNWSTCNVQTLYILHLDLPKTRSGKIMRRILKKNCSK